MVEFYQRVRIIMESVKMLPGHVVPGQRFVDQFYRAVEAASEDTEGLIGVHCTHGLNR